LGPGGYFGGGRRRFPNADTDSYGYANGNTDGDSINNSHADANSNCDGHAIYKPYTDS
jgi:hypothetical protein